MSGLQQHALGLNPPRKTHQNRRGPSHEGPRFFAITYPQVRLAERKAGKATKALPTLKRDRASRRPPGEPIRESQNPSNPDQFEHSDFKCLEDVIPAPKQPLRYSAEIAKIAQMAH